MKELLRSLLLVLSLIVIICFPSITISGASNGLILWYKNILPTLMPFTIIVQCIMDSSLVPYLTKIFGPIVCKIFHISPASALPLLTGYLCGFPMGAISAVQIYKMQLIDQAEAQILSAVCNNSGLMFVNSFLLGQLLHIDNTLPLLIIFYITPLFWLWIRRSASSEHNIHFISMIKTSKKTTNPPIHSHDIHTIFMNSFEIMLKIGIFMMLFSILCEALSAITLMPQNLTALITLLLEITTGSTSIVSLSLQKTTKTVLIMTAASFGGMCISFQTYSVIHTQKLSFVKYLIDKCIISLMTGLLTIAWLLMMQT